MGEATRLGDHGVPVPILQGRWHWGRGKVSSLALERPDPGSPAGAGGTRDAAPWDANAKGPVPRGVVPNEVVLGVLSPGMPIPGILSLWMLTPGCSHPTAPPPSCPTHPPAAAPCHELL